MKKISQFDRPTGDTSFHGKQMSVHTRELAPKTHSCDRIAPRACSLISNQFDLREQNSGAKVFLRNIFFSLEIVCIDLTPVPGHRCQHVMLAVTRKRPVFC